MKILFINPSIDATAEDQIWASALKHDLFGDMSFIPRIAPMVLAAVTPPEHSFTYLDEDIEELKFDRIDADLIAITSMTVQAVRAYFLADKFRQMGYTVVMGGIHASSCPEEAATHADAICTGEAESYWPILLDDFANNRLKKEYLSKDYPPVTELVTPKFDIVKHDSYSVLPLQATRGCPYSCDFCCIAFSSGHKYRMKPVEQVVAEIKALEQYNQGPFKKRYHFVDDNLYVNRDYTVSLFKALKELKITWMGMGSLNTVKDAEVVKLMAESGCRSYSVGFESISEESLNEVKKKTNQVEEYITAAQTLISNGIISAGYFIFGFDQDDENSFRRTTEFTIKHHIINPFFNIMTPFPGTQVYERTKDRIFDRNWSHYGSLKCVFTPGKLSPDQLEKGSYWASQEVARLDLLREHLEYFWSHGPWEANPRLKLKERMLLLYLSSRVRDNKEYNKFLKWAAFKRNAVDVYQIASTVTFHYMAEKFKKGIKLIEASGNA